MSTTPQPIGPATRKVLATIDDPELDARYPNRTHFIDAQNPHQALMTSRALFSGDPVVVVYQDGREVLFTPKPTHGLAAAFLQDNDDWDRWLLHLARQDDDYRRQAECRRPRAAQRTSRATERRPDDPENLTCPVADA
jgi:hypothetical protein